MSVLINVGRVEQGKSMRLEFCGVEDVEISLGGVENAKVEG